MRVGCRSLAIATALATVFAFGATAHAFTASKCSSGKAKLVGKYSAAVLGCYSKASGKDLPVDANCTNKATSKFNAGFQKLDDKDAASVKPDDTCTDGNGDAAAVRSTTDTHLTDVTNDLDPMGPGNWTWASKCTSGKIKCAGKKEAARFGCYSKAMQKNLAVDPNCLNKATTKFNDCYSKLETKQVPPKPDMSNVCVQPNGDGPGIETKVDNYVTCMTTQLDGGATCGGPPGTCPTNIEFTGTSTTGVLDTGWTGQGHDATVISDGLVTVSVTSCASGTPPCGVCNYVGPITNTHGLASRRCTGNTRTICTSNGDCAIPGGTCEYEFGTYLPLTAGGVATCVENRFNGGISGTANIDTGSSAGTAALLSRVFNAAVGVSQPCPKCVGDATINDGTRGGTCDVGQNAGQTCDGNGKSPFDNTWGITSLDCPPNSAGIIASLPIDLTNTTGARTKTLTASNPFCRAAGFTGTKCQCDTCNNAAATPCSNNADCTGVGATVCGGKRCIGGTNNGAPCAANSECPGMGASCNVPGAATTPNQCSDAVCTVALDGEGECMAGPFEQFCGPEETYKGCTTNADCTFPGDTCSTGHNRECFDSGGIGEVVTAQGVVDPPSGHNSDPTLASLFCIGPTSSGAVNGAAGLPGLGRLELTGHAVDNGTP